MLCMHKTTILCQFGLFCHQLTTISPSILNHFSWELYHVVFVEVKLCEIWIQTLSFRLASTKALLQIWMVAHEMTGEYVLNSPSYKSPLMQYLALYFFTVPSGCHLQQNTYVPGMILVVASDWGTSYHVPFSVS